MNRIAEFTQLITLDEVFKEYSRNAEFRVRLETGLYVYAEEMLVVNAPQIVRYENDHISLTEFAYDHLLEYALSFNVILTYHIGDIFDNKPVFGVPKITKDKYFDPTENSDAKTRYDTILKTQETLWSDFSKSVPRGLNCWQMIGYFIDTYDIEKSHFCTKTKLGEHHYLCATGKKKVNGQPDKITVISFTAGYDLPYPMAIEFLKAAGHFLTPTSDEDICYSLVLTTMAGTSMKAKNDWLRSKNMKPLGSRPDQNEPD